MIDLTRWREYGHILTSNLWSFARRDDSLTHKGDYHGNFIPQIPQQFIERFTKPGDTVLDMFCGSGTSMIECVARGRHGVGFDINQQAIAITYNRVRPLIGDGSLTVIRQDATEPGITLDKPAALTFVHPPYMDIVKYNPEKPECLSNCSDLGIFLSAMKSVAVNALDLTAAEGHIILIIGDVYKKGAVIPLGFETMQLFTFFPSIQLKGIIVKDIHGNEKGKGKNANLWRYRHLRNGTYGFDYEYIFVMRKR